MLNDGAAWRRKTNRSSHPGLAAQAAGAAKPAKDPVKGGQSFCPLFFIPFGSPFFCYSAQHSQDWVTRFPAMKILIVDFFNANLCTAQVPSHSLEFRQDSAFLQKHWGGSPPGRMEGDWHAS
jgi:hypothetical protein